MSKLIALALLLCASSAWAFEPGEVLGLSRTRDAIIVFDPNTKDSKEVIPLPSTDVLAVAVDHRGSIVYTTDEALFRFSDGREEEFLAAFSRAHDLVAFPNGDIAVVSSSGIAIYEDGSGGVRELRLDSTVRRIALDRDGEHLVATFGAGITDQIVRIHPTLGTQDVLYDAFDQVFEVAVEPSGTILWADSFLHGPQTIFRFDPDGSPVASLVRRVFVDEIATSAAGRIFASLNAGFVGLFEIDPATGALSQFAESSSGIQRLAVVPAPEPGPEVMAVVGLLSVAVAHAQRGRRLGA